MSKRRIVTFELPWPPSVNKYYCTRAIPVRRGGKTFYTSIVYVSPEGKAYKERVRLLMAMQFPRMRPIEFRVGMRLEFHPATNHNFDTDNFLKCLLDTLTYAGVWVDDGLVFDRRELKRPAWSDGKQKGKVVVKIWKYEEQAEVTRDLFGGSKKEDRLI